MVEIDHLVVNSLYLWYPSCVEVDLEWWLAPSSERLYWLREELCTPGYCISQNPQWRFPVWEVMCGRDSGNLSVWRRGRRAVCSNLETYLGVCDWSTFSNSLSITLCLASFHIAHSYIICLACLCVPHLCLTTRASYSASTLIQRNQEELVQNLHREFARWLH